MRIDEIPYSAGSGGVFADLGVDEPAEVLVRQTWHARLA
jgi:hypothetical protein